MKTSHAGSPCSSPTSHIPPAVSTSGGYREFVSAEKAKCQVMLDILEFLLRFESVGKRNPDPKRQGRLFADIDEARHKLGS